MKTKILRAALLSMTGVLIAPSLAHAVSDVCKVTIDVTAGRYLDKIRVTNQQPFSLPVAGRIMDKDGNTIGKSLPFSSLEPDHSVTITLQQAFAAAGVGYNTNYFIEISHEPFWIPSPYNWNITPQLQGAYISQGTSIPAAPLVFTCPQLYY